MICEYHWYSLLGRGWAHRQFITGSCGVYSELTPTPLSKWFEKCTTITFVLVNAETTFKKVGLCVTSTLKEIKTY